MKPRIWLTCFGVSMSLSFASCTDPERAPQEEKAAPAIRLAEGTYPSHVRGKVNLEFVVKGEVDSVFVVRQDGFWLPLPPPYRFEWDTTKEPEGFTEIYAVARLGKLEGSSDRWAVIIDRQGPTIVDRAPVRDSHVKADGMEIRISFSEPMLRSSVTDDSVRLYRNGGRLGADLFLSADGKLLTLDPLAKSEPDGIFSIELTQGLTDLAGNAFEGEIWAWGTGEEKEVVKLSVIGASGPSVYTNGTVEFIVSATGKPDGIELRRDGMPWRMLHPDVPSAWDTQEDPAGTYTFFARATYGLLRTSSAKVEVTVDRKPPEAHWFIPSFIEAESQFRAQVSFTKPIDPDSLGDGVVSLQALAGSLPRVSATPSDSYRNIELNFEDISYPSLVTVRLRDEITDLAGNPVSSYPVTYAASTWQGFGDQVGFQDPSDLSPHLAARDGELVVVWASSVSTTGVIEVKRWSGSAWTSMPHPAGDSARLTIRPVVALDSFRRPVVAWTEQPKAGEPGTMLYVSRWDGEAWKPMGRSALNINPGFDASDVGLAVDALDRPIVAWWEQEHGSVFGASLRHLFVKRWEGDAWELLGGGHLDIGVPLETPSVAVDEDENPVVAWSRRSALLVYRWTGSSWVPVGDQRITVAPLTNVYSLSLANDREGRLILAWSERASGIPISTHKVQVKRWDGAGWEQLGESTLNYVSNRWVPSISLSLGQDDAPVVAWAEMIDETVGSIYLKRWNGTFWNQMGTGEAFTRPHFGPGMSLAMHGTRPLVALGVMGNIRIRSPSP